MGKGRPRRRASRSTRNVSTLVTEGELAAIDATAHALQVSRSEFMRQCVGFWLHSDAILTETAELLSQVQDLAGGKEE